VVLMCGDRQGSDRIGGEISQLEHFVARRDGRREVVSQAGWDRARGGSVSVGRSGGGFVRFSGVGGRCCAMCNNGRLHLCLCVIPF